MKFKVGIIGKGNVGSALNRGLSRAGYEVKVVGNDPHGVRDVAGWSDVVILAVPFPAIDGVIAAMGDSANDKTIVDPTNLYTPEMMASVGSRSGAEVIQSKIPKAKVVKSFNMHFAKNMDTGHIGDQQLTLFAAGDDKEAKDRTLQLGRDIGFDAVDGGPLANAKLLENFGNLNIALGFGLGMGPAIGFKLVR